MDHRANISCGWWNFQLKDIVRVKKLRFEMTAMEQAFYRIGIGKDYPAPLVDLVESGKRTRQKIRGHGGHDLVKKEKARILTTHTRRKS